MTASNLLLLLIVFVIAVTTNWTKLAKELSDALDARRRKTLDPASDGGVQTALFK